MPEMKTLRGKYEMILHITTCSRTRYSSTDRILTRYNLQEKLIREGMEGLLQTKVHLCDVEFLFPTNHRRYSSISKAFHYSLT